MKKKYTDAPQKIDACKQFCPNLECESRWQIGHVNTGIHGSKKSRYKCKTCGKTFSSTTETALAGLRKPTELIAVVITSLV